jgi:hypothetical protein
MLIQIIRNLILLTNVSSNISQEAFNTLLNEDKLCDQKLDNKKTDNYPSNNSPSTYTYAQNINMNQLLHNQLNQYKTSKYDIFKKKSSKLIPNNDNEISTDIIVSANIDYNNTKQNE